MKRRQFLTAATAFSVAAGSNLVDGPTSLMARPPIRRQGPPRLRVGLAAYSLRTYFEFSRGKAQSPKKGDAIDMIGFLDYCVEQKVEAGELTSYFFPPDADEKYFREIKRQAFLRGVEISGTAIGNNFTRGNDALKQEIATAKSWIEKASWLGAPHIRIFAGTGSELKKHPERMKTACDAVSDCAELAAQHGIFLGVENHGNLTADQMLEIMERIDSDWVGINLDTGNFYSETPYDDIKRCLPFAVNVQVKVSMKKPDKTSYPADIPRIVDLIRDSGYQGYVVLEYEEDDPYADIPAALDALRQS